MGNCYWSSRFNLFFEQRDNRTVAWQIVLPQPITALGSTMQPGCNSADGEIVEIWTAETLVNTGAPRSCPYYISSKNVPFLYFCQFFFTCHFFSLLIFACFSAIWTTPSPDRSVHMPEPSTGGCLSCTTACFDFLFRFHSTLSCYCLSNTSSHFRRHYTGWYVVTTFCTRSRISSRFL